MGVRDDIEDSIGSWTSSDFKSRPTTGDDIEDTNRLICRIMGDEDAYLVNRATHALQMLRLQFPDIGKSEIMDPIAQALVGNSYQLQTRINGDLRVQARDALWDTLKLRVVQGTLGDYALKQ
jgi:hypothetical protein